MSKRGLNSESIMEAACELVKDNGYDSFSLRELASRLGVKPASLYNHVNGIEQIKQSIAMKSSEMLSGVLSDAIDGKERDDAFLDAMRAYRRFAVDNPEMYKALIHIPSAENESFFKAAFESYEPLRSLVLSYGAEDTAALHYLRALRSVMHGFAELTANGFMQRGPENSSETYEVIIHSFLETLKGLPKK